MGRTEMTIRVSLVERHEELWPAMQSFSIDHFFCLYLCSRLWNTCLQRSRKKSQRLIRWLPDDSLLYVSFGQIGPPEINLYRPDDREASIFAHLSNGNNPLSYTALNGDNAILVPSVGTGGVRDPYLVSRPDNSKHWIIATDLDIDSTNWDAATRRGSRGIIVWESTDLVNWTGERLVQVMPSTAGMVWAPEAIWDYEQQQFLVVWSSRLYSSLDTQHTGSATTLDQIFYAYTTDFQTFTTAQPYIAVSGTPVIDLTFLPMDTTGQSYARFIKNETTLTVWEERSTAGLFGTWKRVGSQNYITNVVSEGPLVFWDNQVETELIFSSTNMSLPS
ncbi:hypothetical protein CPB85DRAFT_712218 [Mucidula mucida]|nr:hypothetical protein CPB85DRAFT_712218 [Mucidula mucida]